MGHRCLFGAALKGRDITAELSVSRPFRAALCDTSYPGRCPGLVFSTPLGSLCNRWRNAVLAGQGPRGSAAQSPDIAALRLTDAQTSMRHGRCRSDRDYDQGPRDRRARLRSAKPHAACGYTCPQPGNSAIFSSNALIAKSYGAAPMPHFRLPDHRPSPFATPRGPRLPGVGGHNP
jgi:hypothetical protein